MGQAIEINGPQTVDLAYEQAGRLSLIYTAVAVLSVVMSGYALGTKNEIFQYGSIMGLVISTILSLMSVTKGLRIAEIRWRDLKSMWLMLGLVAFLIIGAFIYARAFVGVPVMKYVYGTIILIFLFSMFRANQQQTKLMTLSIALTFWQMFVGIISGLWLFTQLSKRR